MEILGQIQTHRCLLMGGFADHLAKSPASRAHGGANAQRRLAATASASVHAASMKVPVGATRLMRLAASASSAVK